MTEEVSTYRVVLHLTVDGHPSHWLTDVIQDGLEDELESVRLVECIELHDRPTTVEHHGGGYKQIPTRY